MEAKVIRLNFRKDPLFDPEGSIDDYYAEPYIVELRNHWWNRWKYIIDIETGCPKLFYGEYSESVLAKYINETRNKLKNKRVI